MPQTSPRAAKNAPRPLWERFRASQEPPRGGFGGAGAPIFGALGLQEAPGGLQDAILDPGGLDFGRPGGHF